MVGINSVLSNKNLECGWMSILQNPITALRSKIKNFVKIGHPKYGAHRLQYVLNIFVPPWVNPIPLGISRNQAPSRFLIVF